MTVLPLKFLAHYIPLDTQNVEIGPKLAKIEQNEWKLQEEGVKVFEGVCESVWQYQIESNISSTRF